MDIRPMGSVTAPVNVNENAPPPAQPKTAAPVQIADPVQKAASPPNMQQLADAVKSINKTLQEQSQGVEFAVDGDTDRMIVKVIDHETKEVLRQIPSEEVLAIAKALDKAQGLLLQQKA
jgi:flagellar protein FlaG